jgi:hypothetical protein
MKIENHKYELLLRAIISTLNKLRGETKNEDTFTFIFWRWAY